MRRLVTYMKHMVRWYQSSRLAVGFHSIPTTRRGRPIQSVADAAFVWDRSPVGTPVVVVP